MFGGFRLIITRSPLRLTFGGGGSDVLSYANQFGGFCVSAAINKYVYITVNRTFEEQIFLKYSDIEKVKLIDEIKHPIFREAIRFLNFKTPQIEISSMADIPSSTGLGGSSAFTCALLKALYTHRKKLLLPSELAELACHIEIDTLHEPIGKQDQYISSYGGITCLEFDLNGTVEAYPVKLHSNTLFDLEDNLSLFFTGFSRNAREMLKDQTIKTEQNDIEMIENLHKVKEMGILSKKYLEKDQLKEFGNLFNEQWKLKKERSKGMSNIKIDTYYELGMKSGAIGGKLVGAGGGGFILFYSENRFKLREAMRKVGLEEVRFHFDFEGTKVLL
jgi:D-glycero-alpha-D-manno-heptose-7-phosphate kinase